MTNERALELNFPDHLTPPPFIGVTEVERQPDRLVFTHHAAANCDALGGMKHTAHTVIRLEVSTKLARIIGWLSGCSR